MILLSGFFMENSRNIFFRFSGSSERPAYPGFMVTKMPVLLSRAAVFPRISMVPVCRSRDVWMLSICVDTALRMFSSSLLNSSKQPQVPICAMPKSSRPIDWKSKESSQLNTNTILPRFWPSALTVSVLPVPAGPKGEPPHLWLSACAIATKQFSSSGV